MDKYNLYRRFIQKTEPEKQEDMNVGRSLDTLMKSKRY